MNTEISQNAVIKPTPPPSQMIREGEDPVPVYWPR
jgi:hypothetical protein